MNLTIRCTEECRQHIRTDHIHIYHDFIISNIIRVKYIFCFWVLPYLTDFLHHLGGVKIIVITVFSKHLIILIAFHHLIIFFTSQETMILFIIENKTVFQYGGYFCDLIRFFGSTFPLKRIIYRKTVVIRHVQLPVVR